MGSLRANYITFRIKFGCRPEAQLSRDGTLSDASSSWELEETIMTDSRELVSHTVLSSGLRLKNIPFYLKSS